MLLSFCEAPRGFREMFWGSVDAVAGYRGALGCDFLARGGIPGCDFLPAEVFRTALCVMGAPLFWRLWHSMQAMLSSFLAFAKFGTKKGLLRYRICVPCSKRLPPVRNAFSEALRAQNRLLGYGWDIRYRKHPPTVRDAFPKARRTAFCCTEHTFSTQ